MLVRLNFAHLLFTSIKIGIRYHHAIRTAIFHSRGILDWTGTRNECSPDQEFEDAPWINYKESSSLIILYKVSTRRWWYQLKNCRKVEEGQVKIDLGEMGINQPTYNYNGLNFGVRRESAFRNSNFNFSISFHCSTRS